MTLPSASPEEWVAAWNARNLVRILAHYEDDFEMASPRIVEIAGEPSGVLRGKAGVGAYWEKALRLVSDLRFGKLDVFIGVRSLAIHYRNQSGRLAVDTFEIGETGRGGPSCRPLRLNLVALSDFPAVAKSPANRIALSSQFPDDVEGYVFDGAAGGQVALWTAHGDRVSTEHAHDLRRIKSCVPGVNYILPLTTITSPHRPPSRTACCSWSS